jgi:hypothetical protein
LCRSERPRQLRGQVTASGAQGTGCGVREEFSITNKQKRILDAFEAPLSSRFLWAHTDVLDGPVYDQMRDFNPALTNQPDDFIDSGAGAISQTLYASEKWSGFRPDMRAKIGS